MLHFKSLRLLFLVALFSFTHIADSHAELFISPLRVVFADRDRSANVTLMNTADSDRSYRISWKLLRMKEDGQYEPVPEGTEQILDFEKAVRFSPRQITVASQAKQKIRLSLRRPAELPEGEYRAHLNFTRLAKTTPPSAEGIRGAQLQLDVNVEFSIPIIIRQGTASSDISISNAEYVPATPGNTAAIRTALTHESLFSSYGRIRIMRGNEDVGLLNNIALYPEVKKRFATVPLKGAHNSINGLKVVYEGAGEYRGTILAERQF